MLIYTYLKDTDARGGQKESDTLQQFFSTLYNLIKNDFILYKSCICFEKMMEECP